MPALETACPATSDTATISYRIDGSDTVVWVDDAWGRFALANGADGADAVLGRPLWDFISGRETQLIWRELLARARRGVSIQVPFRCDGPGVRRYLELAVTPGSSGVVSFTSSTVRAIERDPIGLLSSHYGQDDAVRCCSWCKRFDVGGWVDVEEAVERLGLLEQDVRPVTHAMCADCEASVRRSAGL